MTGPTSDVPQAIRVPSFVFIEDRYRALMARNVCLPRLQVTMSFICVAVDEPFCRCSSFRSDRMAGLTTSDMAPVHLLSTSSSISSRKNEQKRRYFAPDGRNPPCRTLFSSHEHSLGKLRRRLC